MKKTLLTFVVAVALGGAVCAGQGSQAGQTHTSKVGTKTTHHQSSTHAQHAVPNPFSAFLNATKANREISEFRHAVELSGLAKGSWNGQSPITLFAPTNEALRPMASKLQTWEAKRDTKALRSFVEQYAAKGTFTLDSLKSTKGIHTLNGKVISVSVAQGRVLLQGIGTVQSVRSSTGGVAILEVAPLPAKEAQASKVTHSHHGGR